MKTLAIQETNQMGFVCKVKQVISVVKTLFLSIKR